MEKQKLISPKRIFFDAGGTLFEVRGSVGEIYGRFARRYGVAVDDDALQRRFVQAFRAQPPLAFAGFKSDAELRRLEYAWWRTLAHTVFAELAFSRFDECFAELFEHFRRAEAWRLFDDVVPTLTALQQRGIRLAVLSNFDSRLADLLRAVELDGYFDAVHISARLGAAKPAARIFQAALQAHGLQAHEAWHVGDSVREDVEGAGNAGIRAWLIERNGNAAGGAFSRLDQLLELLA